MLSFFDALEFALHKRTFILGMIPVVFLCAIALFFAFFSDVLAALGARFDVLAIRALIDTFIFELWRHKNDPAFMLLVLLTVEIVCFIPKSIMDAYFVIKAKKSAYEQDTPFSVELFLKAFLFFWAENVLHHLFYIWIGMTYAMALSGILAPLKDFLIRLREVNEILYYLLVAVGPSLVACILAIVNMPYVMHFNFLAYGRKFVACVKQPIVALQVGLSPVVFWLIMYGIVKACVAFADSDALLTFFAVAILLFSLAFKTGRFVFFVYSGFIALVFALLVLLMVYKGHVPWSSVGYILQLAPASLYFHAYLIFYYFMVWISLGLVGAFAFEKHYLAQGAFTIHKKLYPDQFKNLLP